MSIDYLTNFLKTEVNKSTREDIVRELIQNDWLDEEDKDDLDKIVDALIEYLYKQFEHECKEIYLFNIDIDALFSK